MIFIKGIIGEDTGLLEVITQAEAQQGDTLRVEIDSPGGYAEEGLKIYDYLKGLNRNVVTIAKNQCGSIASVIFMAGTERIATCDIFIHNPFLGDVVAPYLTQEDLQEAYNYLEELKKKINAIYSSVSGMGKAGLQALMDNETAISPEQAVTLGLATKTGEAEAENKAYKPIARTSNEAVLKAINQIQKNMNKKKWSERIKNFLSGKAKNIDLKDKDGNPFSVDIPADRENQVPEVGDPAEPDGQFEMEDGSTVIIADGVITEIRHADEEHGEDNQDQDVESLNARIAELEAENAQLRRTAEMAASVIEEYEALEKEQSKTLNIKRPFVNKDKGEDKSSFGKAVDAHLEKLHGKA